MEWLIFLVMFFIILAALTAKMRSTAPGSPQLAYTKKPALFTPAERSFLGVLDSAVGADYRIFGKVRVADVIAVRSTSDRRAWGRAFGRISAKHFDFVLCSADDLSVVGVIELDDKSHQQRKRQERDDFLVAVCADVNLPLIRIPAQHAYPVQQVRAQVLLALGIQDRPIAAEPPRDAAPEPQQSPNPTSRPASPVSAQPSAANTVSPSCPKCTASMVLRVAKSGTNAGQKFWGCSAYPRCRTIIKSSL